MDNIFNPLILKTLRKPNPNTSGLLKGYDNQKLDYGIAPQSTKDEPKTYLKGAPRAQTWDPLNDNLIKEPNPKAYEYQNADFIRGNEFALPYNIDKRIEYGLEVPLRINKQKWILNDDHYPYQDYFKIKNSNSNYRYPYEKIYTETGKPFIETFSNNINLNNILLFLIFFVIIYFLI